MNNFLLTTLGKTISNISKLTNHGSGSTWPGHIALGLEKNYIKNLLKTSPTQIILIVGTNGKTTTGKMLTTILQKNKKRVFQNSSGANLVNGIASALLTNTTLTGKLTADYAIFEVDENNLPLVLEELTPKAIIALDLFRDQLDRYGELDSIAKKWKKAFEKLPLSTHLILNADDPLIAYLGHNRHATVSYFGADERSDEARLQSEAADKRGLRSTINQKSGPTVWYFGLDATKEDGHALQHAADSLYCPKCNNKLAFQKIFYSHLGVWRCPHCKLHRPVPNLASSYYPLDGSYNKYNTLAAVLTAHMLGIQPDNIQQALHTVTPAFGRQEKLIIKGRNIQIFLAKNPTSFNEALRTIVEKEKGNYSSSERSELRSKFSTSSNNKINVAFVLNDRIPDGRDVSWIWDIDIEQYVEDFSGIFVSGDRGYDMALRIAYANGKENSHKNLRTFVQLNDMLRHAVSETPVNETLYILPTYSAMLDVRKILTGRRIL